VATPVRQPGTWDDDVRYRIVVGEKDAGRVDWFDVVPL
jgi:hypothetical protein